MSRVIPKPFYQVVEGVWCPGMFPPENVKYTLNYKPESGDIFILTYPKCGTTWMQNVALNIFRNGKELEDAKDFLKFCPFIDVHGKKSIDDMPRPGAFKTHLPFHKAPYSPDAKYIIVLRNPKDCCVSFYHHTKGNLANGYWDAEFDDFFEIFMKGEVEYNDYFDHVLSWYPHRMDENIFFTTFEEMKKDLESVVLKLSKFLGEEYIKAIETDNSVLQNILRLSSFDYMKMNLSRVYDLSKSAIKLLEDPRFPDELKGKLEQKIREESTEQKHFFRKGTTGDWKNYFSDEQSERLNQKFLGRLQGTEIVEMYKEYF